MPSLGFGNCVLPMVRNRKIIVYIATSADGLIARRDGSVDWLDRPSPKGDYGMGRVLSIDRRHDPMGQENMRCRSGFSKERRARVGFRHQSEELCVFTRNA